MAYTDINQEWKCTVSVGVNVRSGPSITAGRVGGISYGETIKATKEASDFWRYSPSKGGWFREFHTDGARIMKLLSDTPVVKIEDTTTPKAEDPNKKKELPKSEAVDETTTTTSFIGGSSTGLINPKHENYNITGTGVPDNGLNIDNTDLAIEYSGKASAAIDRLQKLTTDHRHNMTIVQNQTPDQRFYKFDRAGILDPDNKVITTKEYVFFTKPDLHIYDDSHGFKLNPELQNYPIFIDAHNRYKDVLAQLQSSISLNDHSGPFMNLLSNMASSPIDLPAISANDTPTSSNLFGTNIAYRESSESSDDAFEFNVEFEDTRHLDVYMLFKIFDEYERKKYTGYITPKDHYRKARVLHDQFAVYKFIVAEDGESLVYWAKFYGVYPKGVPRDSMNEFPDGRIRFTVPFRCQFMDDMDPAILDDFNKLMNRGNFNNYRSDILPIYDEDTGHASIKYGTVPFIMYKPVTSLSSALQRSSAYKLKWR